MWSPAPPAKPSKSWPSGSNPGPPRLLPAAGASLRRLSSGAADERQRTRSRPAPVGAPGYGCLQRPGTPGPSFRARPTERPPNRVQVYVSMIPSSVPADPDESRRFPATLNLVPGGISGDVGHRAGSGGRDPTPPESPGARRSGEFADRPSISAARKRGITRRSFPCLAMTASRVVLVRRRQARKTGAPRASAAPKRITPSSAGRPSTTAPNSRGPGAWFAGRSEDRSSDFDREAPSGDPVVGSRRSR